MDKETSLVILDDEKNILESMKRLFRDEPFGVFATDMPEAAFEAMDHFQIKVVLSDQRMPSMSGVEFLRKIKERYPDVIRILFTGYTDVQVAQEAINQGEVYRFINKPWDDHELRMTVKDAMGRYDLAGQNRRLCEELSKQNEELKRLNVKLEMMFEAQKEFTSTVSHDLRTPLASIKTLLDIVISKTPGPLTADQENFLRRVKANVDRLSALTDNVLDLAKLEAGKAELNMKETDLNGIIQEVVGIQAYAAKAKGLTLRTELSPNVPKIFTDADRLNQVMHNLIGNAIKFTQSGGIIVSSAVDEKKNHVTIGVKDTGVGIKDEDLPKLFHRFRQLGHPVQRGSGGTGLGLAIAKEIVTRLGGKIWVESDYGQGSFFGVLLPIAGINQSKEMSNG